ncbi:sulfatase-like hydrolase/transferase [Paraburkholderia sp. J63]|uniref:sulfatase-like hydrolase/transferase n=1 Tax=Paraburkholderia sp. J63 TaxID=2805434 RepID=UPI002ABDA501|nr:sulfatase-like hydrolase/transferase [Paraburkholderia sp. J63]
MQNEDLDHGNEENTVNQPSRRNFLKVASAAVVSTGIGAAAIGQSAARIASATPVGEAPKIAPPTPPAGYNILFILTDQERYFDKWPFPVPGREMLKRRGITFSNHQIASSICSASRSTIYTGLHTQHTGVFDNAGAPWQPDMSTDVRTIGHMFHDAGYHAAYLGKWHLSRTMDETHDPYSAPVGEYNHTMKEYGFDDYFGVGDLVGWIRGGYNYDGITSEAAVSWMRTRAQDFKRENKHWFLAVNLVNPHDAMFVDTDPPDVNLQRSHAPVLGNRRPPDDRFYQTSWANVPLPPSRRQPLDAAGRPAAHAMYGTAHSNLVGAFPFTDDRVRIYQDYYFNCIRDCDTHVERMLKALHELNLDENTIVVMTSDHGEYGGYHQMVDKGGSAYRQQNHVPLVISHPAYPGGRECRALTSHIDLAPTLLGLTGMDPEAVSKVAGSAAKGRNFSHLLRNPELAETHAIRPAALFNYSMLVYYDSDWMLAELRAMREKGVPPDQIHKKMEAMQPRLDFRGAIRSVFDGRYRFSRYFALTHFNQPTTLDELFAQNDVELYDLERDPEEMQNLALDPKANGERLMTMNAMLNQRLDEEVGADNIDCMPIHDGRVRLYFGKNSSSS